MIEPSVSTSLAADPRQRNCPTGVTVHAGERYAFSASGQWRDGFKDGGPEGWGGGMPARINRLRGEAFFLLCGTVGQDDRHAFGIGAGLAEWRMPDTVAELADRQLYLFANDGGGWSGTTAPWTTTGAGRCGCASPGWRERQAVKGS
jgi:hypothetical protein